MADETSTITIDGQQLDPPRVILGAARKWCKFARNVTYFEPFERINRGTGEAELVEGFVDECGVCHCSAWLWDKLLMHAEEMRRRG